MPRDSRFANGKMFSVLLDWTLLFCRNHGDPFRLAAVGGWRHRSASRGERHAHDGAGLDSQLPRDPALLEAGW